MKLEIGYNHPFEIRKEICVSPNCKNSFSVLYLSDLHLNKFGQSITIKIAEAIKELDPTIILFGGDYVDSQKGLTHFQNLLSSIANRKHMFAIAGNHDHYFGVDKIKTIILENSVVWLEKKSFKLNLKDTKIKIDGNFFTTVRTNNIQKRLVKF
jgi:hypothetical protein